MTFATLRTFLPEHFGKAGYRDIRLGLPHETLAALDEAEPGSWIAEIHMQALMRRIYDDTLRRDADAYLEFARALAAVGISRFMKVFLSLASERFVLRKIPVVWDRLRRNAGTVTARTEADLIHLEYEGFPFFGDEVYRLLSLANCQALAFAATQRIPAGEVVAWTADTLHLRFDVGG